MTKCIADISHLCIMENFPRSRLLPNVSPKPERFVASIDPATLFLTVCIQHNSFCYVNFSQRIQEQINCDENKKRKPHNYLLTSNWSTYKTWKFFFCLKGVNKTLLVSL